MFSDTGQKAAGRVSSNYRQTNQVSPMTALKRVARLCPEKENPN
jgi:hypothetical protein